jgi:predicted nucleotidyltransferase component of viral defense system
MINNLELISKEKENGYSEANAESKVCQDIILKALSKSILNENVTIKGGVVMRSKTKNIRRATQDLDIDFIKYSLSNDSIEVFVDQLNCIENITIRRIGEIEELSQQDYHGKRIFIKVTDNYGNMLNSKIDLGVHKHFEITQELYCFDVSISEEGASLLINSNEQMLVEKLRSLLKFGPQSTRYKDIFDVCYLSKFVDLNKLIVCLNTYVFGDKDMKENNVEDVLRRLNFTFKNKMYLRRLKTSDKNWINKNISDVLDEIIFLFIQI